MKCNIYRDPKYRKAMKKEVDRTIQEQMPKLEKNLIAMFLWAVHQRWHYSADTLEAFAKDLLPMFAELERFYGCEADDEKLCAYVYQLEKIGLTEEKIEACLSLRGEIH